MNTTSKLFGAIVCALLFFLVGSLVAQATVKDWQKGGSMVPRWDTDFGSDSFKESLRNLANIHANYVTLVIPWYQSNIYSTDIGRGWNTPTDSSLITAIDYAHSLGLKVNLKPHLESYDAQWRANINPNDRAAWFTAYENMLKTYATIGKDHGVEEITIGTELISMATDDANSTNTGNWNKMIGDLRAIFPGLLTYSANWGGAGWPDEKNRIGFWPALDSIGLSAYFPMNTNDTSVNGFKAQWDQINTNEISPLQKKFNKPVVFAETGYRSLTGTHWQPWNFWDNGSADEGEQARLYDALFSYWNNQPTMQGIQLWDWSTDPNAGGAGTNGFTPQNKQAQTIISNWFSSIDPGTGGGTSPPGPSNSSFGGTASINQTQPTASQADTISATASSKGALTAAIVDFEIWNSSGQKVFQKFYDQQNFAAAETKNYSFSWTAGAAGTYTIKMGIFNNNWTTNYFWNANSATFTVISATNNPPPPVSGPATINIWWPGDASHVSDVQPFKANVDGMSVVDYTMYWSVDGGGLNVMGDSNQDYLHKESLVDVGLWHWNGAGPYTVKFTAKNSSGATVTEKQISIYVY